MYSYLRLDCSLIISDEGNFNNKVLHHNAKSSKNLITFWGWIELLGILE